MCGLSVQAADMIELRYQDQDPGEAPYQTRVLITDRHLRLDDGRDSSDFVLLERKSGTLTNILHEQKMLMRMHTRALPSIPVGYKVEEKVTPVRSGTVRVQIFADGRQCSETVAARKLLPGATDALGEYKSALAYTQWLTYQNTPPEVRQVCDLVHHVWDARRTLAQGLPLEEVDYAGRTRQLTASGRKPLNHALFRLPKGYALMQPPDTSSVEGK
jgi:hypothetical protein